MVDVIDTIKFDKSRIAKIIKGKKIIGAKGGNRYSQIYTGVEGSDFIGYKTVVLIIKNKDEIIPNKDEEEYGLR